MTRTQPAAVPTAVTDRVHVPAPRPGAPERPGQPPPRSVTLALSPTQAEELPRCLPGLLAAASPQPGDTVTVDLGGLFRMPITGLELLLTVLWRRVGPAGQVHLAGGTPGLRGQLDSVGISPQACYAEVFGSASGGAP